MLIKLGNYMNDCDPSGCFSCVPKSARNIHLRAGWMSPLLVRLPQILPFLPIFTFQSFKVKASTAVQPKSSRVVMYEEPPVQDLNLRFPIASPSRQTSYHPTDVKHTKAPCYYVLYMNELERTIHHNCWLFHSGLNIASWIGAKTCTLPS